MNHRFRGKPAKRAPRKATPTWDKPIDGVPAVRRQCSVRGCIRVFAAGPAMTVCGYHRALMHKVRSDRKEWRGYVGKHDEGAAARKLVEEQRWLWDFLVVDENGKTVWAKDLAWRYRTEMTMRQRRDWRTIPR